MMKTGQITSCVKPLECERRFLEFLRIVIEGGWIVQDQLEWVNILDFLEVSEEIETN